MARELPDVAPAPARFAHAVLRTKQLDAMRAWWRNLLQARIVFENELVCFLTYDDEHHRLALLQIPVLADPPEKASVGLDHIAFTYADLGDLLATYRRLKDGGVLPYWPINHGPTTSLYYRDPDGNQVELQIDNFEDAASLNAWFGTGAFAANPIGVTFDPEKLLERYLRGDLLEELVQQGSA